MDESEDNMSTDDVKIMDSSSMKSKPKKRSLVERELETNLTARITSPVTNGDTSCTSRYGRARRRKTDSDFTDLDKTHTQWKSPPCEKTPVKLPSPAVHKIHALHSPIKTEPKETPKKVISTDSSLDNQIENIYHENISLSRFGSEEKPNKNSSGPKFPKVYVRTDLIQKREKEGTVTLTKNMFSPVRSPYKSANSHLSNVLERSAEKYNLNTSSKSHNGHSTPSVVKTLDFDSNKKRKKENRDGKTLSKSDLFDVEAKCQYQVGDLAWARMGTYPFWPSIVTREPDSGLFVKRKLFGRIERDLIHVTFFGDNGRRSWILETMLRKFLGQLEFQSAKEWFSPSAKKKDPRLYAAFFISEKKLPQWNVSVEEAEALLREPKRLRIDLLNDMLAKPRFNKSTPKSQKSNKIIRTASDVSLSESLYDTLFSEDDGKVEDPEGTRSKLRTSLDVSEVVTACLDNMAAKTGITKIQRQSHMDRWLQKAKSKTPEKLQTKVTPSPKEKEVKVISSKKKKKFSPALIFKQKPYSFRKHVYESHNLRSHHNEHDYSSQLNDSAHNDSAVMAGFGIGFIAKVESLHGKESVEYEELKLKTEDLDATDSDASKNIENDNTHASENIGLGPIISADDTIDEIQVNMCTVEENAELENTLDTEKGLDVVDPSITVPAASLEKVTVVPDIDLVLPKVIEDSGQEVAKVMLSDSDKAETMSTSKYQLRSAKVDSEKQIKYESVDPSNMVSAASLEKATVVPDTDLVLTKVMEDSGQKVSKVMQSDSDKAETMSTSKYQLRSAKVDSEKEIKYESVDPSNMVPAASLEKATVVPDTDLVLTKVIEDSGQKVSNVMQSDSEKARTMSTSKYQLRSAKVDSEKEIKDESVDPSNMVLAASLEKATVVPDTDLVLTKVIEDSGQKVSKVMQSDSEKAETMSTSKYQLRSAKVDPDKEIKDESLDPSNMVPAASLEKATVVPDTDLVLTKVIEDSGQKVSKVMQSDSEKAETMSTSKYQLRSAKVDSEKEIKDESLGSSNMVPAASLEKATVVPDTDSVLTKVIEDSSQKVSKVMQLDSEKVETMSTSKYELRSAKVDSEKEIKDESGPISRQIGCGISDSNKRKSGAKNYLEKVTDTHFENKIEKPKINLNEIIQLMQVDCKKQSGSLLNVPEKRSENYLGKQITNAAVNVTEPKETNSVKHMMNTKNAQENQIEIKCNQEEDKILNVDIKEDRVISIEIVREVQGDNSPVNVEVQRETILTGSKKHAKSLKTVQNSYEIKEQTGFVDHASDSKEKETKRFSLRNAKKMNHLENIKSTDFEKDIRITMVRLKTLIGINESEQENSNAKIAKEKSSVDISNINLDAQINVTPVQVQAQYEPVKVLASSDFDVKNQGGIVLNVSDKNVIDNKSKLKKTEKNENTHSAKNTDRRKASLENNFDKKDVNVYESVHVDVEKQKDAVRKSDRKEKEKLTESRKPMKNKPNKIKIKIVSPRDKSIQPSQLASVNEPATTHTIESIESNETGKKETPVQPNQSGMEIIPSASEEKPIDTKVIPQDSTVLNVSDKNVRDDKSELKKTEKNKNTDLAKNTDSRRASLEKFVEENNFIKKDAHVYESVHVDVEKRRDTVRKSDRKEKEKQTESRKPMKNKPNKIKIMIVSPRDKPIQPTQLASVNEPATTHQIESIESKETEKKETPVQPNQSGMEIIPSPSEEKPIDTKVIPQDSTVLNVSDKNVIDNKSELKKTETNKNINLAKNTKSRKASLEKFVEENNFDKKDANFYKSVYVDVEKQKDTVRKSDRKEKERKTETSKPKKNKLNKIKIKIVSPRDKPTQPTQLASVKEPATTHQTESIEPKVTEKKGTLVQQNRNGIEIIPLASEQKPIDTKVIPIEDIEYGHLDFIFSSPEKNTCNELDNAVAVKPVLQNESLVSINISKVSESSLSDNNCNGNATVSQLIKRELRVSVEKMCFSNYSDCKIVNGPSESFAKFKKTDSSNTSKDNYTSEVSFDDGLDRKLKLNDSFEEKTNSIETVTLQTPKTVCDSIITPNRPIEDSVPNGELETTEVSTACLNMNNKQDCAVTTIEPLQNIDCAEMTSFKDNGIREHTMVRSVYETVTLEPVENNKIKCDVLDSAEENNKSPTSVDADTFIESVNRLPEPVKVNGFHVDECFDFSDSEFNVETSSINSEDSEPLSITRIKLLSKNRCKVQKALGDPEFVKYMELRQDALMDEHPELSQDEIVEYLFKTWDYEQNTKSDVAKNDDIEQSGLVKGLDNLRQKTIRNSFKRRNKKRDEDTASINSDVSDTSAKRRLRTRVKPPAVPYKGDEVGLSEDHILKIKKESDNRISLNSDFSDDINKNLQSNDSKMLEEALVSEINDASITTQKQNNNDCEKTSPTKGKTEEKRLKGNYVKEKSKSPKSSNDNSIKKYFKDLHQPTTKPAKSIVDVQIEFEEIKEECDLDTVSLNSEVSLTDLPLSKRKERKYGEKQTNKTMTDPDFLKYVELRQDTLIDENPQLTHDEIVAYLYKTWLYEENAKSAIKKSDDIVQAHLVKGLNQDAAPPKKVRKRIKAEKDSDCEDDVPMLKDKPKRKICPAYYNENISDMEDIEDAIELFEIFKPKKKPNVLSPKSEETKPEVKTELAPQDKDTIPEVDPDVIDLDEYDEVDLYFSQLCEPKPNVFKGLVRERVCEICEKTGNLIKCKGCHCMFHEGCAKKAAEVVEPPAPATRGRKKKKKPGRKPKNLEDSESHSDEKSHDASLELNVSADDDLEPRTVNEEDFEALVASKMKELIPDEVNYDSYSSEECLYWNTSAPGKCEIIDIKIKPKIVTDYANFKCSSCEKFSIPVCFVCKEPVSKNGVDVRQKCQTAHCHKYYHLECLDHWPQTQFNGGEPSKTNKNINEHFETLMCPRHVCHTCVSDDPRGCKTRFSGDKLARCVKCPATYHSFTKCLPAGTQILTGSLIVCPRHYENRSGKVPCHVNTGWCFICALGGSLICCEYCPTSFHAECLNISPPEGGYMCEDCETGRFPLYGEMVWVKLGHYRWWPGLILHPSEIPANIMAVKHSPGEFVVRFFGQYDHYWVNRGRVFPFQEGDSGRVSGQKSKIDAAFTTAMEHAQRACEILKTAEPNEEESLDIASSLLPPRYVKLKVNKPCGSLCGRKIDIEESSLTQCECNPDEEHPCGPYSHCLNRMLLTECGPICRAAERCSNRQFEKRLYPKMTPYRTPHRGWGLKTLEDIKAGQFVIEYVGELIDEEEFRRRMNRMHEIRDENFYFLTLDKERMIDAGPKGNLARFMNHCCEPNCETQKWTVLGDIRVGLFALYDIPANSELTFNYNLECTGIEKKRCMCGARRCSGYIGAKPKQDEPQVKKNKRTYKKRKNVDQSPSPSINKPKRPVGRPAKPRELTEIEKDLLIIKNATNGISSDSEGSSRLSSIDSEKHPRALKRKRVSFSTEDSKRVKVDDLTDVKSTEAENSEMSGVVTI